MKKKYTQKDIDQFFGNFKELPDYFELEKVNQLIDNPAAKATQTGSNYFLPKNFLIMTSAIIAVVGSILLWPEGPLQTNEKNAAQTPPASIVKGVQENSVALPKPEEKGNETTLKDRKQKRNVSSTNQKAIAELKEKATQNGKVDLQRVAPKLKKDPLPAIELNTWPADTVIDGTQFLVTLTDEELERLGFELRETGIYYKNEFNGDSIHFHRHQENNHGYLNYPYKDIHDKNIKIDYSHFDFYPVMGTDTLYGNVGYSSMELQNDTLVPVILQGHQLKHTSEDIILWFKMSNNFFKALPERYDHLQASFNQITRIKKHHQKEINIVHYYEVKTLIGETQLIDISKEGLQSLGFEILKNKLEFKSIFEDAIVHLAFERKDGQNSKGLTRHFTSSVRVPLNKEKLKPNKIAVAFVSDTLGNQVMKWKRPNENTEKNKDSYLKENSQFLVPIIIRKSSFPEILSNSQVFWFEPSEELFDALPGAIGDQLRQEYNYLTAPNEEARRYLSTSCTFFETCKSTLQLNNLKLMPNPASYTTTISFEGLDETPGTISLVNLSGNLIKVLVANETLRKGTNTFQLDLTGLEPGIYLISINTNKGFKTQRLVISR
jgi:hypothetical protein